MGNGKWEMESSLDLCVNSVLSRYFRKVEDRMSEQNTRNRSAGITITCMASAHLNSEDASCTKIERELHKKLTAQES